MSKPKPYDIVVVCSLLTDYLGVFTTAEYRFHPVRKWRFDIAWPDLKLALEIQGGMFIFGGHNRGAGYIQDMEKYNEATRLGWRILKCLPKDLYRQIGRGEDKTFKTSINGNLAKLIKDTMEICKV